MNETRLDWSLTEFRVYLLLYAANADFEIKEEERRMILSKATVPEYIHIHKLFDKDSDYERLNTILSYKMKYFASDHDVEMLLDDICELLKCDDEFSINESNFLNLMKKLLKSK